MEQTIQRREQKPTISTSICDVKQGIRNMGDNPDLFRKHFNKFKASGGEILQQLESHINQEDYSNASILCHSIKGLSGMLGLTTLHLHMKEAEYFFRELAQQLEHTSDMPARMLGHIQKIRLQLATDIGQVCDAEI